MVALLICVGLSGCATSEYYIEADRIDKKPDVYVNITEQQIKNYSHLKKAIESEGVLIEIPKKESDKVEILLENKETDYIKYKNKYYQIIFSIACF
jgi:hypothetical protein